VGNDGYSKIKKMLSLNFKRYFCFERFKSHLAASKDENGAIILIFRVYKLHKK
jgi:hypothetical protein